MGQDEWENRVALLLRELKVREQAAGMALATVAESLRTLTDDVLRRCGASFLRKLDSADLIEFRGKASRDLIDELLSIEKGLYDVDDRKDLYDVHQSQKATIIAKADSVVSVFRAADLQDLNDGTTKLNTAVFGTRYNLCKKERFWSQPVGSFATGFVVGETVIATAGHVVNNDDLGDLRFVFGYRMLDELNAQTVVLSDEVYCASGLIGREHSATGSDWALVTVDRRITNHRPLDVRRAGKIADNKSLYILGHPRGLPIKHAGGAVVRDNTPDSCFIANLDAYGGNSGSPVFNFDDNVVEGVLAVGDADFVTDADNNCRRSRVCPATGCVGELCTRTTEFSAIMASRGL
jgi:hypothetical protein